MDRLELFDRSEYLPIVLINRHGSRTEYEFIQYINDPDHIWVVLLSMPYSTAIWQVGDSSEQNGTFNIEMTKAKEALVELQQKKCIGSQKLEATDIMLLMNKAFSKLFGNVNSNKKAIAEQGWFPFN